MRVNVDAIPTPTADELAAMDRELAFVPVVNDSPKELSTEQIAQYNAQGYLMPFEGLATDTISELRSFFDQILQEAIDRGESSYSISTAHLRFAPIYDLMFHPAIISAVKDLLGEDLIAWGSHFFCKMPHDGKRVPWHQDATYWPLTPTRTVTVWLAIDDATPENANMRFIPRSHVHGIIDYEETTADSDVLKLAIHEPERYGDDPVDVSLKAGQFSLHADLLLHGSEANDSDCRRSGLTMRYAAAEVRADYGWHKKGVVVSGEDTEGHWLNAPRPA